VGGTFLAAAGAKPSGRVKLKVKRNEKLDIDVHTPRQWKCKQNKDFRSPDSGGDKLADAALDRPRGQCRRFPFQD
jgi:hypothetical protein